MSYKMKCFRFTRTASVMDLRTDAAAQELKRIARKATQFAVLNPSHGIRAVFN